MLHFFVTPFWIVCVHIFAFCFFWYIVWFECCFGILFNLIRWYCHLCMYDVPGPAEIHTFSLEL